VGSNPARGMDVCVVLLYKDSSMKHERQKDLKSTKWIKGKNGTGKKKSHRGAWLSVSCQCCVLSGRGLCDGLIPRPEGFYRVCCVSL
jgi:hypothetical protein